MLQTLGYSMISFRLRHLLAFATPLILVLVQTPPFAWVLFENLPNENDLSWQKIDIFPEIRPHKYLNFEPMIFHCDLRLKTINTAILTIPSHYLQTLNSML